MGYQGDLIEYMEVYWNMNGSLMEYEWDIPSDNHL